VTPSPIGFPGRWAHRHRELAVDERLIGEGLALQTLFDRLSRLLGQLAGVALLASAGAEPDRQISHLAVVKEQLQAVREALAGLARPRHLAATFHAMVETLALMDEMTAWLDRRPAAAFLDDSAFCTLMERLSAARRLLLAGSAPGLGIGLVDFAGSCCALGH
jgi:hypothetical protein